MFRKGRRKTACLRGTAGLGVVLMVAMLYRPAFAMVPGVIGRPPPEALRRAFPPGRPDAAPAPAPAPAAKPPADRVRSAIVPTALKIESGAGADSAFGTQHAWALFDGDGATPFEASEPVRIRLSLPSFTALEAIGIYGDAAGVVSVYTDGTAGPKPIAGLERLPLKDLPLRWNRFEAEKAVEAASVILEITPAPGGRADVREVELWGQAGVAAVEDLRAPGPLAEVLLTHLPPGAVSMAAEPSSVSISAPEVGTNGGATLDFALDRPGRTFERAFLVYQLEGLTHWSSALRRINGQQAQGGFHADHAGHGGLQVEEISPAWLRAGRNTVEFLVANKNDPLGYKVKNLRVVGIPAAGGGAGYLTGAAAAGPARTLVDGSRETGLGAKDLAHGPRSFDLAFAGPSQPESVLVAVEKGAKGGIAIDPIVKGKAYRAGRVTADVGELAPGWNRIPLGAGATEADGVRVTLAGTGREDAAGGGAAGLISELRVTGSRRPNPHASGLVVTYPLHGECVDGEAYLRGFLRADGTGSVAGATLQINGTSRPGALAADGEFGAVISPPKSALKSGGKWQVELDAAFANGDSTGGVVDIEGCQAPVVAKSPSGPVEDAGAPFGQWVKAGEAANLAFAGASLDIPAGALEKDTRITIRPISGAEVPATDETLTNVTPGGRAYRLGPHGLKFAKAVALTVPYDRDRFVGGQDESDLGAYYFNEDSKRWTQVQTVKGDGHGHTLTAASMHFTDFISGTISTPDHPTADSFNPTSIKDIKAGDPAAEIDLIQPPQPSPDGAAHVSFPIWVPPGRMGMQPQLAATYSSDAGNGFLGVGWDIPISSIQVDTRFGVPRYDLSSETESYSLDGELLVMDPTSGQSGGRVDNARFHRRSEGKFDTIIRTGPGPKEQFSTNPAIVGDAYHFEVIDKRGTHYFYGETYFSRGSLVGRGVSRWYLSRVRDVFGNQILYSYNKQPISLHGSTAPAVEMDPNEIQYTADSTGANYHYRVKFEVEGTSQGSIVRPDVITNARGGTIAVTQYRLAHIEVIEVGGIQQPNVRRYDFPYQTGAFGKSLLSAIVVGQGLAPSVDFGGNEFYRHTFKYSPLATKSFETPVTWSGAPQGSGLSDVESDTLSGTAMAGWGPGLCQYFHGVTGGSSSLSPFPFPIPPIFPQLNQDTAQRGFLDVNGDGLPDLVGSVSNSVLLNGGDSPSSANRRAFVGTGLPIGPPGGVVNHATRWSAGLSTGAHVLFELGHSAVGKVWGATTDDTIMADIDGDGLVDYLTSTGFSLNKSLLGQGFVGVPWATLPQSSVMPKSVVDEQRQAFALAEPVAQWTAPFSGHMTLLLSAQKVPNKHATDDGVTVFFDQYGIRPQSPNPVLIDSWSQTLVDDTQCGIVEAPTKTGCVPVIGGRSLTVRTGDRIYFRADSIDDITDDAVNWDPVLSYVDVTDDNGNNAQTITSSQRELPEPFSGAAFDFPQGGDMRLAGKPAPVWKCDLPPGHSAGVRLTWKGAVKHATSDRVSFQVLKIPAGATSLSSAIPIVIPNFQSTPYGAHFDGPIPDVDFEITNPLVGSGDRLLFQVSSDSPIDPTQISWAPHVEYLGFCRYDNLPPQQQVSNPPQPSNLSAETTVCGAVTCASTTSGEACTIAPDTTPSVAATLIEQDVLPYFELKPWRQVGIPAGFFPPSDGQLTISGVYQGTVPARVVARGLDTLLLDQPAPATFVVPFPPVPFIVPNPSVTIPVFAGHGILFDAFMTDVDASVATQDTSSWVVGVHFTGAAGDLDQTITARRNYLVNGDPSGSGHVHGWSQFEWNVTPQSGPFNDTNAQKYLAQGLSTAPGFSGGTVDPTAQLPLVQMREAPQGLSSPDGNVPGPLWVGGSADGYIGQGVIKPSRTGRPMNQSVSAFQQTNTSATDVGASTLFSDDLDFSDAETQLQFIDMDGDRYPDLVTNGGIQFNRPQFNIDRFAATPITPLTTIGGLFEPVSTIELPDGTPNGLHDLQFVDGRQVTVSLGISTAVASYIRATRGASSVPSWVSLLPTIGIAYGHAQTKEELLDINGDGLPDHVARDKDGNLLVRMNLGYDVAPNKRGYLFTEEMHYNAATWEQTGSGDIPTVSISQNLVAKVPTDFGGAIATSLEHNGFPGIDDQGPIRSDALRLQASAGNNAGSGYSYYGGNVTGGVSRTVSDMIDLNGDGLPDMVKRWPDGQMSVKFNLGDDFAPEELWTMPAWPQLPDPVGQETTLTVGFGSNDALAYTATYGGTFSVGDSEYFETEFAGCWGGEAGIGAGKNATGSEMRFEDIDGDGAPDQVLKINGDSSSSSSSIFVRRNPTAGNNSSAPNLLNEVDNPLGGRFVLGFTRVGNVVDPNNHVDMPHSQMVLSQTLVDSDFTNGTPDLPIQTLIDYGVVPVSNPILQPVGEPSGFYDRATREFLGYGQITTTRVDDNIQVQRTYDNNSYATRHLLLTETTRDVGTATPKLLRQTKRHYDPRQVVTFDSAQTPIQGSIFPALDSEQTKFFESTTSDENAAPVKSMTVLRDYDVIGDVDKVDDLGDDDPAVTSDDAHYLIAYQVITDPVSGARFPRPGAVVLCKSSGVQCPNSDVVRRRDASYGPHGEMLTLLDYLIGGKVPATGQPYTFTVGPTTNPSWGFTYDGFGNLQTSTDPNGYVLTYTYDSTVNTFIARIQDSFGYFSTRGYDTRFGKLASTTDVNGQQEQTNYDLFGRLQQFCGPGDVAACAGSGGTPTIAMSYAISGNVGTIGDRRNLGNPPYFALTQHKDVGRADGNTTDTLDTVVFVDGLDRVRQTKKDAFVDGVDARILSGQVNYDRAGRVSQEGFPSFETTSAQQTTFDFFAFGRVAKSYNYDVLNRVTSISTADDKGGNGFVTTHITYSGGSLDGRSQLTKTVTDPQSKVRTQYLSPRQEILAVTEQNRLGTSTTLTPLTTRYFYDQLSQLQQVKDPSTNVTTASYDSLGHMVLLKSLDAGQTEWRYDVAGKLAAKETAVLRSKSLLVNYTYETNRLKTIVYPPATGTGSFPGATALVTYTYGTPSQAGPSNGNIAGRIANVTDESGAETRQYDALGNVSVMVKTPARQSPSIPPVNYEMDYAYDAFGRVLSMTYPDKEVVTYGYDSGGLPTLVKGTRKNGAVTTYVSAVSYNEREQRDSLTLGNGAVTTYGYYPDTKRLQELDTNRPGGIAIQRLAYTYDLVGNITGLANNIAVPTPVTPNTVIAPGPNVQSFGYDDLYQLTSASGSYQGCAPGCGNGRKYTLTMQYDGLGNISRKNQTDNIEIPAGSGKLTPQAATSYNNPYTYSVVSAGPHAPTAIGNENLLYDVDGNMTAAQGSFGPSRTLTWTEDDRLRTETDSGFTNTYLYDAEGTRTHKRRTTLETVYVNPNYVVKNRLTESKHIMLGNDRVVTAVATITGTGTDPSLAGTNTLFYYHPDHLQSTGFVTGSDGSILQHDEYFPSGEVWFGEQKNNDVRNTQPYLFNAKELDETGLYYFSARYYNPKFSMWISPDPAFGDSIRDGSAVVPKRLWAYSYGWNNPIVMSDPTGLDPVCSAKQCPSVEDQAAREEAVKQRLPLIKARQKYLDERVTAEVGGVSYSSITRRELLQKQRVAEADENLARLLAGATDPSVAMSGTVVLEYPMGFDTKAQFEQATKELRETLKQSGISDVDALGVRGSSATGWSDRKGRAFGPDSDVDYFVESAMATKGLRQSEDIPGFVHPSRLRAAFPLLGRWADRWSGRLGRKVSTGGFAPGTVPAEPAIKVVP